MEPPEPNGPTMSIRLRVRTTAHSFVQSYAIEDSFGVPYSRLNRVSKASKLELQNPEVTA
jgi:hypothetical protein